MASWWGERWGENEGDIMYVLRDIKREKINKYKRRWRTGMTGKTLGVGFERRRRRVIYDRTFYRETRFPRRKTTVAAPARARQGVFILSASRCGGGGGTASAPLGDLWTIRKRDTRTHAVDGDGFRCQNGKNLGQ